MNGVFPNLQNIATLSDAKTRMVSPENVYGEKGRGAMAEHGKPQEEVIRLGQLYSWDESRKSLGQRIRNTNGKGWKVRPYTPIPIDSTTAIMDVPGPGTIQHIWMTTTPAAWSSLILRMYWDDEEHPSVEVPLGQFFCNGWANNRETVTLIPSVPINVNQIGGLNCYFPMPFGKHARITIENTGDLNCDLYYSIIFSEGALPSETAYFHAQYHAYTPVTYKTEFAVLDNVSGRGHYVGVNLAWRQHSAGWWGEGEVKFFLDGDDEYPSLVATGIEDYFGGAWCFKGNYAAPFMGYPSGDSCERPHMTNPGTQHTLYRFHLLDPIRFSRDIRINMQALAHMPLEDDVYSAAYWYQDEPHKSA